jgi:hypothetical protein
VRFTAEHQFSGPVEALTALLLDPAFHTGLELPDVGLPEVVEAATQGDEEVLRLRYEYTGQLDPIARRLLGNRKLTWLQEMRVDREIGTGRLSFHAEADPQRLHGRANVRLEPTGAEGHGSRRRLEGRLTVSVPVVGGTAERRIIEGLLRRLDVEARALDERLRADGG